MNRLGKGWGLQSLPIGCIHLPDWIIRKKKKLLYWETAEFLMKKMEIGKESYILILISTGRATTTACISCTIIIIRWSMNKIIRCIPRMATCKITCVIIAIWWGNKCSLWKTNVKHLIVNDWVIGTWLSENWNKSADTNLLPAKHIPVYICKERMSFHLS